MFTNDTREQALCHTKYSKQLDDCFSTGSNYIYMYILYICLWPLTRLCIVYIVKEVNVFRGAQSINGCGALELYRPAERKLCSLRRNWNYTCNS